MKRLLAVSAVLVLSISMATAAFATNGMDMEAYGPVAGGLGGASMAYDNGTAAVMNNPATIGMMPESDRLDIAIGFLGPHVQSSSTMAPAADSSADAFYMPAIGWVRKSGNVSYGLAMFSQGGMGTQYDASSFLALGSGNQVGALLGVGRVMVPIVYSVTPNLNIGGSLDYVWATLDLQMAVQGSQLAQMVTGCAGMGCLALGPLSGAPWARIDFSDGGAFNGAARGNGIAGKLGFTYKIGSAFSIGGVYQSKTSMNDLQTGSSAAVLSAAGAGAVGVGKIMVKDFNWPETYAIGVALTPGDRLMIVADIKQINWRDVMESFKMTYQGGIFGAPTGISFTMPQNWSNQVVYQIGAALKFTDNFTGRIGANLSKNPIPDMYLNPLFPAIEKNHYTIGAGYMFGKAAGLDASFTYAPQVSATNGQGITINHYQTNAQVMYSYRF
jgi:long-chain fatty acid transport protein